VATESSRSRRCFYWSALVAVSRKNRRSYWRRCTRMFFIDGTLALAGAANLPLGRVKTGKGPPMEGIVGIGASSHHDDPLARTQIPPALIWTVAVWATNGRRRRNSRRRAYPNGRHPRVAAGGRGRPVDTGFGVLLIAAPAAGAFTIAMWVWAGTFWSSGFSSWRLGPGRPQRRKNAESRGCSNCVPAFLSSHTPTRGLL